MSAPLTRRHATYRVATGGTLLALECARNVYSAIDRRLPEASALTTWLAQSAAAFGLSDADLPGDPDELGRSRRRGVTALDWRKVGAALRSAATGMPSALDDPATQWL